jgi:hypothetical protein
MYLLHTQDLVLHSFQGSLPEYAILSHTWDDVEVEFNELRQSFGSLQSHTGYRKISKACSLAARDGYGYIWIDTCCIDKSSSAELSEAINSMFALYRDSARCYAYLSDIPFNNAEHVAESRWFTRGWTLQELLAPETVHFYSSEWKKIGSKTSLQDQIAKATGIPEPVLSSINEIWSCSIACRMSWAAKRKTTRIEDKAYCLLGIFGVNMPLLYGESEKAFSRL